MTNLEKYNKIFEETLNVSEEQLAELEYQGVQDWDSVGHMSLVAEIEDTFSIEMETDDIIEFSSYKVGMSILKKYKVNI